MPELVPVIDSKFAILGAAVSVLGDLSYAVATVRGKARPNRVSWFLWATIPMVAFFASASNGYASTNAITLAVGIGPALVFIASFVDSGAYWRITPFDWICGGLSLVAVAIWLATANPTTAIALSILADTLAAVPTLLKSWQDPRSEPVTAYVLAGIGGAMALLTVQRWTFEAFAFPSMSS